MRACRQPATVCVFALVLLFSGVLAMVEGRIFMRGYDGVYCYDLRKKPLSTTYGP
jgi:hypothetical protein